MERHAIEQLLGLHTNPIEGLAPVPDLLRAVRFDRAGGYIPLGSVKTDWSTETDVQPSSTYDEHGMALLPDGKLWNRNTVIDLTGTAVEGMDVALSPLAGLHTRWSKAPDGSFSGAAFYRPVSGVFEDGTPYPGVNVTTDAGTGVTVQDYEFLAVFEGATANGLVVYHVEDVPYTPASEVEAVVLTVDTVLPEGYVVRFYWRPEDESAFELLATRPSGGVAPVSARLTVSQVGASTFIPTADALLNFTGRTEPHNRRFFGRLAPQPFTLLDRGAMTEADYFETTANNTSISLNAPTGEIAGPSGVGSMQVRVGAQFERIIVERFSTTDPVQVSLVRCSRGSPTRDIRLYLEYPAGSITPRLRFSWNYTGGVGPDNEVTWVTDLSTWSYGFPTLGTAVGSTATVPPFEVSLEAESSTSWRWRMVTPAGSSNTAAHSIGGAHSYPSDFDEQTYIWRLLHSTGGRLLRIKRVFSRTMAGAERRFGIPADANSSVDSETFTSSDGFSTSWLRSGLPIPQVPDFTDSGTFLPSPDLALGWTSFGSVNRGVTDGFLVLEALTSARITALTSTPAGLLVFCDNETFLLRGDPATDLNVQRLSGTIGCDQGIVPARLGSVVFPIHKGRIYAVNMGMGDVDFGGGIDDISTPVWRPDQPFVQVVGEPLRNHLVARTASGVYRYQPDAKSWANDVFDGLAGLDGLLPACLCPTYGTRYLLNGVPSVVDSGEPGKIDVRWSGIDLGDRNIMKLWRRVEVFTGETYTGVPLLVYSVRGETFATSGQDLGQGRWLFTFDRGLVGTSLDLSFTFEDVEASFVLRPPVVVEYAPRYRQR